MDAVTLILSIVRQAIEASGAPPDALQDVMARAEIRARERLGGGEHYIRRVQDLPAKTQVLNLLESGVQPQQIVERLGLSKGYVYRVCKQMRQTE